MAVFEYLALNLQGKRQKGAIEAENARHARQLLREKNLMTLKISSVVDNGKRTAKKGVGKFKFLIRAGRMGGQNLSLVTRQMATLLQAGIPVDEVLLGVASQSEQSHTKAILLGVRAKVMEGYTLASAIAEFPAAFPRLYCTTIAAGEKSGNLGKVLTSLAEYTEKQRAIKRKIQQALIYPSLMMLVSIAVIIFMLTFVVPKIISVFNQTNQVLPMATKILLLISSGLERYGDYLLAILLGGIFLFRRSLNREKFRKKTHRLLLKTPLLGKSICTINSSRFARTFGILTEASVPVLEAMQAAAKMINSLPMQQAALQAIDQVREGTQIHLALKNTGYFSPMFIHLVSAGEMSGQLERMLIKAAENQEAEVSALIDGVLTLFEPVMILIMGGVVLFIVMAVMLPIFALDNFGG